ncbi:hypothetical protein SAMN05216480_10617 [Pustulibacterium marinum]|uniref:Uncharacterized protein n=1 Tax=Pustulibacterium marinum TaxID=1224947 RepID=A0A1I7GVF8_9FLAO|nr:hypothetical protein [Pustulibacterium marinum]SFU52434.1 hypothetical protein SAMN05216480_10617 [Pustulibacterium marinum]
MKIKLLLTVLFVCTVVSSGLYSLTTDKFINQMPSMKNYRLLILGLLLALCSCNEKQNVTEKETVQLLMINASDLKPYHSTVVNGVSFDYVIEETDTIYATTKDANFKTIENYKVGTRFGIFPDSLQKLMVKESGWGYYVPLLSGWNAAFCIGNSCTDSLPNTQSKIQWFFKRKTAQSP